MAALGGLSPVTPQSSGSGLLSQANGIGSTTGPISPANGPTTSSSGSGVVTPTAPSVPSLQSLQTPNYAANTYSPTIAPVPASSTAGQVGALTQANAALDNSITNAKSQNATALNATSQNATASDVGQLAGLNANGSYNSSDSTNAASQLDSITSANSPYIQLAEQQGLLSAASRGLENSSIGAGASEAAAVAAAAPLAEQNASEASQGALQNSQLNTAVSEQNAQLGTQVSEQNAQLGTQAALQNAQLGTQVSEANSAAANTAALQNSQLGTQANEFNASQDAAAKELQAQLETSVGQSNAQLLGQNNQFNASQIQQAGATNAAAENQMQQTVMGENEAINQQYLSGNQAQNLAAIQGQYNQLISTNQSASSLYQTYFSSIGSIMANQNIAPSRVASSVQAQQAMLQSGLAVIDALNGGTNVAGAGYQPTIAAGGAGGLTTTPAPVTNPLPALGGTAGGALGNREGTLPVNGNRP